MKVEFDERGHSEVLNYSVRPRFKATRDVTRGDIAALCAQFGPNVSPAMFSAGGICFARDEIGSNGIRFFSMNFPWVSDTSMREWVDDPTVVLNEGVKIGTVFKTWLYKGPDFVYDKIYEPIKYGQMEDLYEKFNDCGLSVVKKSKKSDFDDISGQITFQ